MKKTMVELFAGVGGFRLGMDRLNSGWETVWFSQWEPGARTQWAYDCYVKHFGKSVDLNGNDSSAGYDISEVDKTAIPNHTLLVGGFPCQDYSVAHSLSTSKGIEGKKGVLWWQIRDTLIAKETPFVLLENVDRLIKSPAKQRGRDFGVILACLNELNYSVEWRVVNAALYGGPQRRRRTFIFAYKNDTKYGKKMAKISTKDVINNSGLMVQAFPITAEIDKFKEAELSKDIVDVSDNFKFDFDNAGFMRDGIIYTAKISEKEESPITLKEILEPCDNEDYFIKSTDLPSWVEMKGAKKKERTNAEGFTYTFSEGAIPFLDYYNKPGRTMLTSEGTKNRSTHIIADPATGTIRLLTPVECERLQGFDDNWTDGMPDRMRRFCMGNALVVPMVSRLGVFITLIVDSE
ncbi:MAG: DNA (cytosine-5-)-methyltransferase [Erysipelotrichaceae bacterium]|nr:DNA (cytosine-5-)-methyltransferase [Erysipelotrichaceae bacterium]